jgi:polyisoprenoid-binding protein YceI
LESPDDAVLNTATVGVSALVVGLAAGAVWRVLDSTARRLEIYAALALVGFGIAAAGGVAAEDLLEGSIEFIIPLAAIVFALSAPLPPILERLELSGPWPGALASVGAVAALAMSVGLSGQGDAESGRLALPDPAPTSASAAVVRAQDIAGVTFTVVPGESKLTYTVREKLASSDAVGRTTELSGTVQLDGSPTQVSVDLSTLESDQSRRDNRVRDIFQSAPVAEFTVSNLGELPAQYVPGETVTSTVTGSATIRGVERPLTFAIEARLDGDTLSVLGTTDFTWADFEIDPPNIGGFVQVEDNVHIEVLVVAKKEAQS